MKKQNQTKGILILLITATIWGTAFVAQSVGMDHLGAFTFNGIRSLIGAAVLLPFIAIRNNGQLLPSGKKDRLTLLSGGLACGIFLCIASNLQQLGISHSTVGKSAFITTLYIVFVPILGLFLKRKASAQTWVGVVLALFGLYLLCMKDEGFVPTSGDWYLLFCAFFFALQIMAVDHFSPKVDGLMLSMLEFLVTGILSLICMLLFEEPSLSAIKDAAFPIFYAGAFSCGAAYTFQVIGQKYVQPAVASLIMSLESVIAALSGWLILKEVLSGKELFGCMLVFCAILLTQIPLPARPKQN